MGISSPVVPRLNPLNHRTGVYWSTASGLYGSSTAAMTADRLHAAPVFVGVPFTFTALCCEVTTGAGSLGRIGLYAHNTATGLPETLILDAGTFATNSAAIKEIAISHLLLPGVYWIAVVFDNTPTLRRPAGGADNPAVGSVLGISAFPNGSAGPYAGVYGTHVFAALPAAFPAATWAFAASIPSLALKG